MNSFSSYNGHRIHNGNIERRNLIIKQLFANAYGFYNFSITRNQILYVLNHDSIIKFIIHHLVNPEENIKNN